MVDEADIELRVIIQYTTQPQYLFHSFVSVFVTLVFLLVYLFNNFAFCFLYPSLFNSYDLFKNNFLYFSFFPVSSCGFNQSHSASIEFFRVTKNIPFVNRSFLFNS